MSEPCMCGAPDCRVCGPLQGYTPCPHCNRMDCEDHAACEEAQIEAAEAKAEARQERQDEARLEHKLPIEWGGVE